MTRMRSPHSQNRASVWPNFFLLCSYRPIWERLINDTLAPHERIFLVTVILSDPNQVKTIIFLPGVGAQMLFDNISEASHHTISQSRDSRLTLV